jgi:hypothetical protein
MKLPSNATNEEKERFAYIEGGVNTAKLYQEVMEAEQREVSAFNEGYSLGVERTKKEHSNV